MEKVVVFYTVYYLIIYSCLYASQQDSGGFKAYKNDIKRAIEVLGGSTTGLTSSQSPISGSITNPYQEHIRFGVMRSDTSLGSDAGASGDIIETQNQKDVVSLPHVIHDKLSNHNDNNNDNGATSCQKKSTEIFQRTSSLRMLSEDAHVDCNSEEVMKDDQAKKHQTIVDNLSCKNSEELQGNKPIDKETLFSNANKDNESSPLVMSNMKDQQGVVKIMSKEKVFCPGGCC